MQTTRRAKMRVRGGRRFCSSERKEKSHWIYLWFKRYGGHTGWCGPPTKRNMASLLTDEDKRNGNREGVG